MLAVADETTPYINEEVAALRELLPKGFSSAPKRA